MEETIGWELYRSFLGVLHEGSLSAAARSLGLTQPTVGRHVAALERALGQALFTRSQAGLMPTEAALAMQPAAEAMQNQAAALERTARGFGAELRGAVRVSASEVVAVERLPPVLAALREAHPQLQIELVPSNRLQDLVQREADIAVRMAPPQQEVLVATRVDDVLVGLHAHERYLARHGVPQRIADLQTHALIGFDVETPYLRAARQALPLWQRANFALRCDSDLGQLALIRAGAGIGACQTALAGPGLVRVLAAEVEIRLPAWIVMHGDLRNSRRCRVVYDALVQALRAA
ncbi:LysR family transcriptional regulator [Rubrivivax gelatinosus]|uniref:LysR family transcriptional regulator n=1 Tax=Rubrivivax gelatinosus TaxID=28068 RepID=A0ABS1DV35_RUBGE|nr:LysR family transcriptional regulator [Rubrivivax gelatinosus]MBK1614891.1 LysR family transcriptional regulator [Rubrivivax gelatinosus]MBK1713534.1 LysR family transcriptional regulator [Rubrivivax gelatinosus]